MKCKTCGTDHRGVAKHGGYCLDHQEQRAESAEAALQAVMTRAAQLEAERDEAQREIQQIRTMLDDGETDESITAIEMVKRMHAQCYEFSRQLEQAQQQIAQLTIKARHVWLDDALNSGDGTYRP